jgi:hypothetical protein
VLGFLSSPKLANAHAGGNLGLGDQVVRHFHLLHVTPLACPHSLLYHP